MGRKQKRFTTVMSRYATVMYFLKCYPFTEEIRDRKMEILAPYRQNDINSHIKGTNVANYDRAQIAYSDDEEIKRYERMKEIIERAYDRLDDEMKGLFKTVYIREEMNVSSYSQMYLYQSERTGYQRINTVLREWLDSIEREMFII